MLYWNKIPFDIYKNIIRFVLIDKYKYKITFLINKNCNKTCKELIKQFIIIQKQFKKFLFFLYLKSKINYRNISKNSNNITINNILWNGEHFKNIVLDIYRAKRLLITISKKIY